MAPFNYPDAAKARFAGRWSNYDDPRLGFDHERIDFVILPILVRAKLFDGSYVIKILDALVDAVCLLGGTFYLETDSLH